MWGNRCHEFRQIELLIRRQPDLPVYELEKRTAEVFELVLLGAHRGKRTKSRDSIAKYAAGPTLSSMVCLLVARKFLGIGGSNEIGFLSHLQVTVSFKS